MHQSKIQLPLSFSDLEFLILFCFLPFSNGIYQAMYKSVSHPFFSKVMVWIHGGNFIFGGASRYDGSALAAYENIVVVLIQYRLGLLGFFK